MSFHAHNKKHIFKMLIVLASFFLGLVASFYIKELGNHISFIADIYIGLLQMAIIPFIFLGIIKSLVEKRNQIKTKKGIISTYMLYWIIVGTIITIVASIVAYIFTQISSSIEIGGLVVSNEGNGFNFKEILTNLFPNNILKPLTDNNILTVIILALILGLSIRKTKHTDILDKVVLTCDVAIECMQTIIDGLIKLLPIFIFISSTSILIQIDNNIWHLFYIFLSVIICLVVVYSVIYPIVLLTAKKSPLRFYKIMITSLLTAFTTCSSIATFPVMLKALKDEYKTDNIIINMLSGISLTLKHSQCLQLPIYSIFAAKLFNIPLTFTSILFIILISVISSIGTVGIPGGALASIMLTFNILGLPAQAVGIIAGIYILIDMPMTMLNITDDAIGLLVAGREIYSIPDCDNNYYCDERVTADFGDNS